MYRGPRKTQEAPRSSAWERQALCFGVNSDAFFETGKGAANHPNTRAARRICTDCPVILECLQDALAKKEPYVRGGLVESERRANKLVIESADFTKEALLAMVYRKLGSH